MTKYIITAMGLKLFSSCSAMRRMYRFVGNTYGMKKRLVGEIPSYYIERIKRLLHLSQKYNIVKDGDRVLEVGTGWMHWEAITIRLFFDIEATLFDIWDNRQFEALKHHFSLLGISLDQKIELSNAQRSRAQEIIKKIASADSLETLYEMLGFKYVVDGRGSLSGLPEKAFDVIVSGGVLEHIGKIAAAEYAKFFYRLLKPGGYSVHSINMGDHLYAYDKSVSRKEYLRFSDTAWKYFFQNDVQYINRIQCSEWLSLFDSAGLRLVDKKTEHASIGALKIHKQYSRLLKSDIDCTSLKILHRKPFSF